MAISELDYPDPSEKAYKRVGRFLYHWSSMENQLNAAIGKALGLTELQTAIVCSNIQLRNKIHILKTAISVGPIYPPEDRERFTKFLQQIADYSYTRNMFAHDLFLPTEDYESVEFFVTRAKGKLDFPKTVWGDSEFAEAYAKLDAFKAEMKLLISKLGYSSLIDALLKAPMPPDSATKASTNWLELLSRPAPQLQADHTSDTIPPTPETDGENRPKPDH